MIAGVCGGLASALRVDATLIRLAFSLLALAGGAGILLYFALWAHSHGRRPIVATGLAVAAILALLVALGMSGTALIGAALILGGAAVAAARGGSLRPGGSLPVAAIALTTAGAVILLGHLGASGSFVAPGAIAGTLVLVLGPVALAARRRAGRAQARWLGASRRSPRASTTPCCRRSRSCNATPTTRGASPRWRAGRSASCAAGSTARGVQARHARGRARRGSRRDRGAARRADRARERRRLPSSTTACAQLVLAAREAMANAAKFSGADEISVYAEADAARVACSSATAAPASTAPRSRRTGAASRSRSRAGMTRAGGTAAIVVPRRARAPRSS